MGKFIERKEVQKTSAEMKKLKKETMAKYFYDLSKLTFTAMQEAFLAIALAGIGNSLLK